MSKPTTSTAGNLLLSGIVCCGSAYIFLTAFLTFPEQESALMQAILATAVMLGSAAFTLIVYVITTNTMLKKTGSERFTFFTLAFLAFCVAIGLLLPVPAALQTPVMLAMLLLGFLSLGIAAVAYKLREKDQERGSSMLSFRERYLRW